MHNFFSCNITSTSSSLRNRTGDSSWQWYSTGLVLGVCNIEVSYRKDFHLQCNRTVALDAFFKQIVQDPVKISWIGSGCSVATEPTAEISHYYNITQVIQQWNHPEGWKSSVPSHAPPYPVFLHILLCWASWPPAVPLLLSDVSYGGRNCRRVFCCYQAL